MINSSPGGSVTLNTTIEEDKVITPDITLIRDRKDILIIITLPIVPK